MPAFIFNLARSKHGPPDLVEVEADRESAAITEALTLRPYANDDLRWRLISRRSDIASPVTRQYAKADLANVGLWSR